MYRKLLLLLFAFIIIISLYCVLDKYYNIKKHPDMSKIEYRNDKEPLIEYFNNNIIDIESRYWKTGIVGKSNFGPTSYWIKGFIVTNKYNFTNILTKYSFSEVALNFNKGMEPEITGYSEFKWCYNNDLSQQIINNGFIGNFYFDIENGIFYFDVESN